MSGLEVEQQLALLRAAIIKPEQERDIGEVLAILANNPELRNNLHVRDASGINPLMHALMRDNIAAAQLLIAVGAVPHDIHFEPPVGMNMKPQVVQRLNTKMRANLDKVHGELEPRRMSSGVHAANAKEEDDSLNATNFAALFIDRYWQQYDASIESDDDHFVSKAARANINKKFTEDINKQLNPGTLTVDVMKNILSALRVWQDPSLFDLHPAPGKWDIVTSGQGIKELKSRFTREIQQFPSHIASGRDGRKPIST